MKKYTHFSLKKYNTFNIDAITNQFVITWNIKELTTYFAQKNKKEKIFVLGGGSNVLFKSNFEGTILYHANNKLSITEENEEHILVEAGAGINWDDFVSWSVENNYYGAENLSLIPGNIGASPVQNIGAYGTEAKDIIEQVIFFNMETHKEELLNNQECNFLYRDSIFKNALKDKIIIDRVIFRLSKKEKFNLSYKALANVLENKNKLTLRLIRNTVIEIRNAKLPDPKITGNAGSFFKNPIVQKNKAKTIACNYPDMPLYPVNETEVKIAAGWLIEKTGLKGYKTGNVGIHNEQALVLVNYGKAKGEEIIKLAEYIQKKVLEKFDIKLEPEVNYI